MQAETRVCPYCGAPPGSGVFCASCGHNLADVAQLPTRAEWQGDAAAADTAAPPEAAARVANVDAFLTAMHAAGDPGVVKLPESRPGFLGRVRHAHGWIVRPVARDKTDPSRGYTRGVFLATSGRFHRLESTTRGWGQRGPHRYLDTVGPELEEDDLGRDALLAELATILAAHDIGIA